MHTSRITITLGMIAWSCLLLLLYPTFTHHMSSMETVPLPSLVYPRIGRDWLFTLIELYDAHPDAVFVVNNKSMNNVYTRPTMVINLAPGDYRCTTLTMLPTEVCTDNLYSFSVPFSVVRTRTRGFYESLLQHTNHTDDQRGFLLPVVWGLTTETQQGVHWSSPLLASSSSSPSATQHSYVVNSSDLVPTCRSSKRLLDNKWIEQPTDEFLLLVIGNPHDPSSAWLEDLPFSYTPSTVQLQFLSLINDSVDATILNYVQKHQNDGRLLSRVAVLSNASQYQGGEDMLQVIMRLKWPAVRTFTPLSFSQRNYVCGNRCGYDPDDVPNYVVTKDILMEASSTTTVPWWSRLSVLPTPPPQVFYTAEEFGSLGDGRFNKEDYDGYTSPESHNETAPLIIPYNTVLGTRTFALVVASYSEDLQWLNTIKPSITKVMVRQQHPKHGNSSWRGLGPEFVAQKAAEDATIFNSHHIESRGHCLEGSSYLAYIVRAYDSLPDYIAFVHGHQTAWHQDQPLNHTVNTFNWTWIVSQESTNSHPFVYSLNINHWHWLGMHDRLRLAEEFRAMTSGGQVFDHSGVLPEKLAMYQAAQYFVGKEAILRRPKAFWLDLMRWCRFTTLGLGRASRLMEYSWRYLFSDVAVEEEHKGFWDIIV